MSAHRLVLATRNKGKIEECRRILEEIAPDSIELLGLEQFPDMQDVEETGSSFQENSLLKARAICKETGLPALADDSGICIDALGGAPGIFSARWSGVHGDDKANIAKVLTQLDGLAPEKRGAHFTCVTSFVTPDGFELTQEGILRGYILNEPIGTLGFGYDPIFVPEGLTSSFAQMQAGEKDAISHRGKSLRAIAPQVAVRLRTLG